MRGKGISRSLIVGLLWASFLPARLHAVTPAGTLIFAQGKASYFDVVAGAKTEATSNAIILSVKQSAGVAVTASAPIASPPGQYIQFPHILSNTGNGPDTFNLVVTANGSIPLEEVTLFDDPNGNGKVDSGELPITLLPEIKMGQSRSVVVSARVPPTATTGLTATLFLIAHSSLDPFLFAFVEDAAEVQNDTLLNASLAAVPVAQVSGGTFIEYSFSTLNQGIPPAQPVVVPVLVGTTMGTDGIALELTGVLLSFPIPANTLFESAHGSAPADGFLVYRIGEQWRDSFNPLDKAQVKRVGMILTSQEGVLLPAQTAEMKVQVRVLPHISKTTLSAVAQVSYTNNHQEVQVESNPVVHAVDGPPDSTFFTNARGEKVNIYHSGETIYITAIASSLNKDPLAIETAGQMTIRSSVTGDQEMVRVIESGENTGIFTGTLVSAQAAPKDAGSPVWRTIPILEGPTAIRTKIDTKAEMDGVLTVAKNSPLQLVWTYEQATLKDEAVVDPAGVVFNSVTNTPMPGVTVTLLDAASGETVFLGNGKNPVTTGQDGSFSFDLPAGPYRLKVSGLPTGFSFPSVLPSYHFTASGRTIDPDGSYGKNFKAASAVLFDSPVDPSGPILFVQKTADRRDAEVGDVVTYTVKIKNPSTHLPVTNIQLFDRPPIGLSYVRGSTTCLPPGGTTPQPMADPPSGYPVIFGIQCTTPTPNHLNMNEEATLTYKAIIGPGALVSDGINRIYATGDSILGTTTSNAASTQVKIVPGVFTDRAIVIGKVFIDMNENGEQDPNDPGVPGVRLILEDGTSVITDESGKYSLYGLRPTTHVLKVDPLTLPPRFILVGSSTRFSGDPRTRFMDLTPGELHKANFMIAPLPKAVWEPILEERKKCAGESESLLSESALIGKQDANVPLSCWGTPRRESYRDAPSLSDTAALDASSNLPAPAQDENPESHLRAIAAQAEQGFKIVEPAEKAVIPIPSTNVIVTGPPGLDYRATVNGDPVSDHQVGGVVLSKEKTLAVLEWVAIPLISGKNVIKVQGYDPFGNLRAEAVHTVFVPGRLEKVEITANPPQLPADGVSTTTLTLRLFDRDHLPVLTRVFLTVTTGTGTLLEKDLDPDTPGLQIAVERGEAQIHMRASAQVEDAVISVTAGGEEVLSRLTVPFLPPLREMMAVGLFDGAINLRTLKGKIAPIDPQDRFEDGFTSDGRAAFYLKGKIKGEHLLTLAYDSDKEKGAPLFRDIQPDAFYPIYGDSSVKGFDAQSTKKLYVKVERGKSYLLYGDFDVAFMEKELARYQRSLTGLKYHFEDEQSAITAFHNRSEQHQVVERIPANGTSGLYRLTRFPIVENSDIVEILTVDRERPEIVIKIESQARFSDYTLDTRTGEILFRSPVPSFDKDFNPIVIRVTYETLGAGTSFDTYGIEGKKKWSDRVQLGGTLLYADEPKNRFALYGSDLRVRLIEGIYASGELALSDSVLNGTSVSGTGLRVAVSVKPNKKTDAQVYWLHTDSKFQNPSANINRGKTESGLRGYYIVREGTILGGETFVSNDALTGGRRSAADIKVEQAFGKAKGEVGVRHINDTAALSAANTFRLKGMSPFPNLPQLMTTVEYEQAFNHHGNAYLLGADYPLNAKTKLYGKQEWISGPSYLGRVGLAQEGRHTKRTIGLDTSLIPGTTAFTEYRMAGTMTGREDQAAIGLRNRYTIKPGVTVLSTFEQTEVTRGAGEDSVALSAGMEHLSRPDIKGSTRAELRSASSLLSHLWTGALVYRLNEGVSLLTRETFYREDRFTDAAIRDLLKSSFTFGTALRPASTDRVHLLSKYVFLYRSEDQAMTRAHVGSVEGNVSLTPKTTLFLKYGARLAHNSGISATTQMIESRVTYDMTQKIDIGVEGRHIGQSSSRSALWGYGLEGGYQMVQNVWLSLGYQVNGLDQDQFTNGDAVASGAYLRLRYKFDEGVINFLREGGLTLKGLRSSSGRL